MHGPRAFRRKDWLLEQTPPSGMSSPHRPISTFDQAWGKGRGGAGSSLSAFSCCMMQSGHQARRRTDVSFRADSLVQFQGKQTYSGKKGFSRQPTFSSGPLRNPAERLFHKGGRGSIKSRERGTHQLLIVLRRHHTNGERLYFPSIIGLARAASAKSPGGRLRSESENSFTGRDTLRRKCAIRKICILASD